MNHIIILTFCISLIGCREKSEFMNAARFHRTKWYGRSRCSQRTLKVFAAIKNSFPKGIREFIMEPNMSDHDPETTDLGFLKFHVSLW